MQTGVCRQHYSMNNSSIHFWVGHVEGQILFLRKSEVKFCVISLGIENRVIQIGTSIFVFDLQSLKPCSHLFTSYGKTNFVLLKFKEVTFGVISLGISKPRHTNWDVYILNQSFIMLFVSFIWTFDKFGSCKIKEVKFWDNWLSIWKPNYDVYICLWYLDSQNNHLWFCLSHLFRRLERQF